MYGAFLRDVRRSRGMSQAQLAANAGISQPNLSAYERDRRVPTMDTLVRLLAGCGYELAAVAGPATIYCPLPLSGAGSGRLPGDPPDERPALASDASDEDRARVLLDVLDLAEATR